MTRHQTWIEGLFRNDMCEVVWRGSRPAIQPQRRSVNFTTNARNMITNVMNITDTDQASVSVCWWFWRRRSRLCLWHSGSDQQPLPPILDSIAQKTRTKTKGGSHHEHNSGEGKQLRSDFWKIQKDGESRSYTSEKRYSVHICVISNLCCVDIYTGKPASKSRVGVIPANTRLFTVRKPMNKNACATTKCSGS